MFLEIQDLQQKENSEVIQLKIDTMSINATEIARIATIPLIIVGLLAAGCVWEIFKGYVPSRDSIEFCLSIDVPLILIIVGVWLSRYRLFLYLGRIGTVIWLLPLGFHTMMIFGELQNTEPIVLVVYFIVLLCTILSALFLWRPKKKEGEKHKDNPH